MYTNCRSNSLLEWKIIADQEAENYLFQSFLKKVKEKKLRNSGHHLGLSQPDGTGTAHTIKAKRYMEEDKIDNREEEGPEIHNKATDKMQYGETSHKEPSKETESDKTKEPDSGKGNH